MATSQFTPIAHRRQPSLYIYISTCVHIYIYTYIYTYTYTHTHTHTSINQSINLSISISISIGLTLNPINQSIYLSISIFIYCIHLFQSRDSHQPSHASGPLSPAHPIYIHIYIQTHTHTHIYQSINLSINQSICLSIYICTYIIYIYCTRLFQPCYGHQPSHASGPPSPFQRQSSAIARRQQTVSAGMEKNIQELGLVIKIKGALQLLMNRYV